MSGATCARASRIQRLKSLDPLVFRDTVDGGNPANHLGYIYIYTHNLVNNGIHYLSTGAGFQPSTVPVRSRCFFLKSTTPQF